MPTHNVELFPPIHLASPTRRGVDDPHGYLPWIRRVRRTKHVVLSYDAHKLRAWFWPVYEDGSRVTPDDLVIHRLTHKFLGPGCLCSSCESDPAAFTEAAIFCVTKGKLSGLWVAACAQRVCKYFVILEHYYIRATLPLRVYPLRDDDDPAPPPIVGEDDPDNWSLFDPTDPQSSRSPTPRITGGTLARIAEPGRTPRSVRVQPYVTTPSETSPGSSRSVRGTRRDPPLARARDLVARRQREIQDPFAIDLASPIRSRSSAEPSDFSTLMKLDDLDNPGLTATQFRSLFVRCQCSLIMTNFAYSYHDCNYKNLVIDLTQSE